MGQVGMGAGVIQLWGGGRMEEENTERLLKVGDGLSHSLLLGSSLRIDPRWIPATITPPSTPGPG